MSVSASNPSVQQSLRNSAIEFANQQRVNGFREFQVVCCASKQAEHGVYGKLWEVLNRPAGNPDFGRQAFHDVNGNSSTLQQKADAIVRYITSFLPQLSLNQSRTPITQRHVRSTQPDISLEQRNTESAQSDLDEIFRDPVTYDEPMTDPVIDQAGHTFDRSTIQSLISRNGQPLQCPIGREAIDIDRLVPNIFARNISDSFNNDENFGFDPATQEPMTDPLIDQAGHTFDRSTIDMLIASTHEGESVECPLGGEEIDVDRLVPNILARDAIERFNRDRQQLTPLIQTQQLSLDSPRRVSNMSPQEPIERTNHESMQLEPSRQIEQLIAENRETREILNQYILSNQQLVQTNQEFKDHFIRQGRKIDDLTNEVRISSKKISNVAEMSTLDKVKIVCGSLVFCPNHLEKVMNRGLPTPNQASALPSSNQRAALPSSRNTFRPILNRTDGM